MRPESDREVSARQWAVLCGDPSARKSPCIRAGDRARQVLHHELYERWREANEGVRKDERDPVPALYTSDSTIPALGRVAGQPRGLLMLTEEFASWVGGIDSADRGESAKNRGDWLQLRDGGPHQITNRVERGAVYVPNWGVSVLAACTPDGLAKQMKQMPEDGLIHRFAPCIMATPDLDVRADARGRAARVGLAAGTAYIVTTTAFPTWLRLSEAARILFEAEERSIRALVVATEAFSPAYAAHVGKHPGMLAEVALTFPRLCARAGRRAVAGGRRRGDALRHSPHAQGRAATRTPPYSSILSTAPRLRISAAVGAVGRRLRAARRSDRPGLDDHALSPSVPRPTTGCDARPSRC